MSDELRMAAYYYRFNFTGNRDIDLILCAVASAGKSFHHTDQWNEEADQRPNVDGNTPIEWIQNAAAQFMKYAVMRKIATDMILQDKNELLKLSEWVAK